MSKPKQNNEKQLWEVVSNDLSLNLFSSYLVVDRLDLSKIVINPFIQLLLDGCPKILTCQFHVLESDGICGSDFGWPCPLSLLETMGFYKHAT